MIRILNEYLTEIRIPCKYYCRKLITEKHIEGTKNISIELSKYIIYVAKRPIQATFEKLHCKTTKERNAACQKRKRNNECILRRSEDDFQDVYDIKTN